MIEIQLRGEIYIASMMHKYKISIRKTNKNIFDFVKGSEMRFRKINMIISS